MARVLLAEDDTSISEPLSRALRREGYDVDITADGPSTLDRALGEGVDLILLDIGLPDLDGLEVCRRVGGYALRVRQHFPESILFPQLERMIHADQRRSLRSPIPLNRRIPQPSPKLFRLTIQRRAARDKRQNFHPNCR